MPTYGNSRRLIAKAQEIWDRCDSENRAPTDDERAKLEQLHKSAEQAKGLEGKIAELEGDATWLHGEGAGKSPGQQFVESKGYKTLIERGLGSGAFSTGQIEVDTKGTLATTPGTALTPGGYLPGITEILAQRLYVADLFPQARAPMGGEVRYVSETTATNAAAPVSELGTKPESTLVFGEVSEPIRKIATLLPISDELLEDAPQISAYLNQRLTLFVQQQEEAQLLLGSGTAPALRGLIATTRAIGTYARGTADDNALALFKAMNGTRGSSFLDPDAIIIHPSNWQAIRTAKDSQGQYMGGGPFFGPYGGPQGPAGASQFSADSLWGVRVVVTSAITVGTALVGAFGTAAAIHRRGGLTVEATNSHGSYFAQNVTAIRAEQREALCVYRPTAFTAVTGLSS